MKKLMKFIMLFSLTFVLICSSIFCNPIKATDEIELRWKNTVDENGEQIQILDMTEEEIELYQISQLKKKYESNNLQRTSGYTYEYEKIAELYDTGDGVEDKILIGKLFTWAQRDSLTVSANVSFTLMGAYKAITGSVTLSATTSEEYHFNGNYENCLGLFAQVFTTKYKITKKDKYTGATVSVTYDNIMSTMSKSVRKIYNTSGTTIKYLNNNKWATAKMLKNSLTTPPTSSSSIVDATTTVFR